MTDLELASRLARLGAKRPAPTPPPEGPVAVGERLVLPYESVLMPEWLVLAVDRRGAVVVPLLDEGDPTVDVALRVPPAGARVWARVAALAELSPAGLEAARRLEAVDLFYVEKAQARIEGAAGQEAGDPDEATRLVAAWGGARLTAAAAAARWGAPGAEPLSLWRRRPGRAVLGLAAAAAGLALVVAAGISHLVGGPTRARPGLYRLRGAGEAGVELRAGGVACLAQGLEGSTPCPLAGSAGRIALRYRRDPGVAVEHLLVVAAVGARLEVLAQHALPPTADGDGKERCEDGLCPLEVLAPVPRSARALHAILSPGPLSVDDLAVTATAALEGPPGTISYGFLLRWSEGPP